MPQHPNDLLPLGGQPPRNPERLAMALGHYILAFVRITFWVVVGSATCAAGYVALRIIWVAAQLVLLALGE